MKAASGDPLTEHLPAGDNTPGFFDRDDVEQTLDPGRLDQTGHGARLTPNMLVVDLQSIPTTVNGAPRVRRYQFSQGVETILLEQQRVDAMIKALADPPDGARAGLDAYSLSAP
jgi:hypothetical protein